MTPAADTVTADSVQPIRPPDAPEPPPWVGLGPPPPPPPPDSRDVRVCAGGDVLLGNNLDTLWAVRRRVPPSPDPSGLLAPLVPLVRDADIMLLNIEGAIGEGPAPSKCRPGSRRCYAFRQPPTVAAALNGFAGAAELVANVANNHAMDARQAGFEATQRHLGSAGVYVTGADTLATRVVTALGDTVGFLGFSTFAAGSDARDLDGVQRHVSRAAARYPRLIVTVHMGAEGVAAQRTPDASEVFLGENRGNVVAFARVATAAGASAVIGHGPHVLRAAEWHGDALVVYSLGNLLTYGPFSMEEPLNRGGIVCADLDVEGRVSEAVLRSTWQRPPGFVQPDPSGRGAWLVDSLSRLDFPETGVRLVSEAVVEKR